MSTFTRSREFEIDVEELFGWHERPGALPRLTPPWESTTVVRPPTSLEVGTEVVMRTRLAGPVAATWHARHIAYDPPHAFRDVQDSGPFAEWDHTHRFTALPGGRSRMADEVVYRLPFGALGETVAGPYVRGRIERMFRYRHAVTAGDLAAHARARQDGTTAMHVAVTGASGLIGTQLCAFLTGGGHRVTRLVRRAPSGPDELAWDPAAGTIDADGLRGVDAVVHLAGEGIGDARWSEAHKRRVLTSRVEGTGLLARTLAALDGGPRVLVSGSAIGWYGAHRGDERLTEDSETGDGFLAELVRRWEAAAQPAVDAGLRVALMRTGIVQSPAGGVLKLLLPMFSLGLGGRLGSGRQYVSWITIDDVVGIFAHALANDEVRGPVNATAPSPVTNGEYARVLARVLRRPALLPVPRFGPALLLGAEGADQTAFASQRVLPTVAERTGYSFRHRDLESGLRHVLGR